MKVGSLVAYKEKYNDKTCFYFDNKFIKKGIDILQTICRNSRSQRELDKNNYFRD